MLMRKLEMKNFRQYIGDQTVEFSEDPEKNVTLILGKNTSGKTTLIQAFRWVLYNDCNFTGKKEEPKAVLNNDVRKSMQKGDEAEVKVTLTFVHKGTVYEISRKYIYKCKIPGDGYLDSQCAATLYAYQNGERVIVKGGDSNLEHILPESLSEYFFFDGEKIAESRNPDKVKYSINNIMGLVPVEHMKKHLAEGRSNVVRELEKSLRTDSSGDINRTISTLQSNLEAAEKNKNDEHKHFEDASQRVEKLYAEMEQSEEIAKYAAKLRKTDKEIRESEEKIRSDESDIERAFADAMYEAMGNLLASDIYSNLSESKYEDKGIPGMDASAIHYLLEHGKCICGADLSKSEECRKQLIDLLTYLPPESIGTQISRLTKDLKTVKDADDKQQIFSYAVKVYNDDLAHYEELNERIADLSDKVKDKRDADLIMEDYKQAKEMMKRFHASEVNYASEAKDLKKQIDGNRAQLESASRTDSYNKEILLKKEYVKALYDKASSTYESNSSGIFEEMQKTLVEVFNSMYHGTRKIELTPDFKVRLTVGGESLDNSKGLDTVQNFAFIASLLKVAKERSKTELGSEPYPLAMDAVFSNTDKQHIINICNELPKLAEQAILALMEKDWAIASSSLEGYVGKMYRINKISETRSEITEVKEAE